MYPNLNLFGTQISVYFIFLSCVFSLVVPLIVKRTEKLSLSSHLALDIYLVVLLGSFLGARLFYILYQEPSFYFSNPMQILYFWNGGYVFFGGLIGAVISGAAFCRYRKASMELWLNFAIPVLSLGYAIGRMACFLSGCCYGKESDVFWSVFMHGVYRHPTQIYAVLMEFCIFVILTLIENRRGFYAYLVLPTWLVLHGFGRIVMEMFRDDPRGRLLMGLSVSTVVSIVLMSLGLCLFVYKRKSLKSTE